MKRYLLLFSSTRAVLVAERLLRAHALHCTVIPVPRTVSSECGMAIEIAADDRHRAEELCRQEKIDASPAVWERKR